MHGRNSLQIHHDQMGEEQHDMYNIYTIIGIFVLDKIGS